MLALQKSGTHSLCLSTKNQKLSRFLLAGKIFQRLSVLVVPNTIPHCNILTQQQKISYFSNPTNTPCLVVNLFFMTNSVSNLIAMHWLGFCWYYRKSSKGDGSNYQICWNFGVISHWVSGLIMPFVCVSELESTQYRNKNIRTDTNRQDTQIQISANLAK